MSNRKEIRYSVVSFIYSALRFPFTLADLLPFLAAIYISFVFSSTLISLFVPNLSIYFESYGFEKGLMGGAFGVDLRKANLNTIGIALSLVPAVFLVAIRSYTSTPPRSYIQLCWTLIAGFLAIVFFYDAAQTGQNLVQGTKYDSVMDIVNGMTGFGSQFGTEYRYSTAISFFAMTFYIITFTYFILAIMCLILLLFRKLPLSNEKKSYLNSPTNLIYQSVRSIQPKAILFCIFKLALAVFLLNLVLLSDQLTRPLGISEKTSDIIGNYPDYLNEDSYAYFGLLSQVSPVPLVSTIVYFIVNSMLFNYENLKSHALRFITTTVVVAISIYFAVLGNGKVALGVFVFCLLIAAFFPAIIFLKGLIGSFTDWCKMISIKANKDTRENQKPILLLRPFSIDNTKLKNRQSPFLFLFPLIKNYESLEETISKSAYRYGPLIAVGKPGEQSPPLGAIREYFHEEEWQPFVERTVNEAQRIVFICGATKYTRWETERILEYDMKEKLVLVMPPIAGMANEYFKMNPEIVSLFDITDNWLREIAKGNVLCIYRKNKQSVAVFNYFSATQDYQLALDNSFKP